MSADPLAGDRLAAIRQRRALTADWHEDFGDHMHRCKVCGEETTIWDGIGHEPGCPVRAAMDAHDADDDWLDAEVEKSRREINELRAEISLLADRNREFFGIGDELDEAKEQVERLRGEFRQLEWAGRDGLWPCCPVCHGHQRLGHVGIGPERRDCWLEREIGVETAEASPIPESNDA